MNFTFTLINFFKMLTIIFKSTLIPETLSQLHAGLQLDNFSRVYIRYVTIQVTTIQKFCKGLHLKKLSLFEKTLIQV